MTPELKTLKDLEVSAQDDLCMFDEDDKIINYIVEEELRQEAIKWIKQLSDVMEIGGAFDKYENEGTTGNLLLWIKHFFNITDAKLNEK